MLEMGENGMYYKKCSGTVFLNNTRNVVQWVKWAHHLTGFLHCAECLSLNGCFFTREKAPSWPHHEKCHCTLEPVDYLVVLANARTRSDYKKFDPYLFNTLGIYKHKKEQLFAQWGYTVDDAKWLQSEMERQAHRKYTQGEYELGKLDLFGQQINIRIEIPRRDQPGSVSFISGWTVRSDGELRLNTPYGGK